MFAAQLGSTSSLLNLDDVYVPSSSTTIKYPQKEGFTENISCCLFWEKQNSIVFPGMYFFERYSLNVVLYSQEGHMQLWLSSMETQPMAGCTLFVCI